MMEDLKKVFEGGQLGICVKSRDGKVIFQNDSLAGFCGKRCGSICTDRCMVHFESCDDNPALEEGMQSYKNKNLDGDLFDIVFIVDKEHQTTMLYPLAEKQKSAREHYEKFDLTKREKEVLFLILDGATNNQITKSLTISINTLKTHIRNIYQKVPKEYLRNSRPTSER